MYYLYHDDGYFFYRVSGEYSFHIYHALNIALGRYLGAFLLTITGWLVESVADLNLLRLLCVVQLSLCALFCAHFFRKYLDNQLQAILAAMIIFTLPPFQSIVSWGSACYLSFTIPFVLLSLYCALETPLGGQWHKNIFHYRVCFAVFFNFCALCIYPSMSAFYWSMCALVLLSLRRGSPSVWKQSAARLFFNGILSIMIYGVTFKITQQVFHFPFELKGIYSPYNIATDYLGKMRWFIQEPLFKSLNLFHIYPTASYAYFFGMVIASAFGVYALKTYARAQGGREKREALRQLTVNFLMGIALLFLSFLPNLLAQSNIAFYRCSAGLTSIIAVAFIWSLKKWAGFLPIKIQSIALTIALAAVSLYALDKCNANILWYRALPSHLETLYIKNKLQLSNLEEIRRVHFIRPKYTSMKSLDDEFGTITSHYGGDLLPLVNCLFKEFAKEKGLIIGFFHINSVTSLVMHIFADPQTLQEVSRYQVIVSSNEEGEPVKEYDEPMILIDMVEFLELYPYRE